VTASASCRRFLHGSSVLVRGELSQNRILWNRRERVRAVIPSHGVRNGQQLRLLVALAAACASFNACGGSSGSTPNQPTSPAPTLRADLTDASGDTVAGPDIISASLTVASGELTISVRLAPGTLNTESSRVVLGLDTDQNGATGTPFTVTGGGNTIGQDFQVTLRPSTMELQVFTVAGQSTAIAPARITVTGDQIEGRVPMSMLGSDDGRITLRVFAIHQPAGGTAAIVDLMPDASAQAAIIQ